jgi:cytidylate kinase
METTTVLTVSRQLGCGGAVIGQAVAKRLGMRYADGEILERAAKAAGLLEGDLAPVEERSPGFWQRVLESLAMGAPDTALAPPIRPSVSATRLFEIESTIIREIAASCDAVIVGRAGFHVLAGRPGVTNVMVHARLAWRIRRVMEVFSLATPDEAAAMIEMSDRRRAQFIRTVTGMCWTDACAFDLCVDTSATGLEVAVEVIATLLASHLARNRGALAQPAV